MTAQKPIQMELVGRKIRQLRRQRKLTQTELAEKIGIHQSDLSRMEQGEYKVGLDALLKILQSFNLGIGEFFEERPKEFSLVDRYRTLSEKAQHEVDSFIEFKQLQEVQGGSLDGWEDGGEDEEYDGQ